jgi:hypothetical protein
MSNQITITLPADTIQLSISSIRVDNSDLEPIANLSDEWVLASTELQMESD